MLLPYNYVCSRTTTTAVDVDALLALCAERNVAVQTIKSIARRRWAERKPVEGERRQSWYEPLTDPTAIARAVQYVLRQPQLFVDSSSALDQLPKVLAAADTDVDVTDEALGSDVTAFDIAPLFDGAELERI